MYNFIWSREREEGKVKKNLFVYFQDFNTFKSNLKFTNYNSLRNVYTSSSLKQNDDEFNFSAVWFTKTMVMCFGLDEDVKPEKCKFLWYDSILVK